MIRVHLSIKNPERKTSTIISRISYLKNVLKYYIPNSNIPTQYWDKSKQQAKKTYDFDYHGYNLSLQDKKTRIEKTIREYLFNNNDTPPTPKELKAILDEAFNRNTQYYPKDFTLTTYFEDFIERSINGNRKKDNGLPISTGTIKSYKTKLKILKDFFLYAKKEYDFNEIGVSFYDDFKAYLTREKKYTSNYIGMQIKVLKTVLNEATAKGINKNFEYQLPYFKSFSHEIESIYLNDDEIKLLANLDLSNHTLKDTYNERQKGKSNQVSVYYDILERARDQFLIAAYTGMRYSDLVSLDPSRIINGYFSFVEKKTNNNTTIPIRPEVMDILAKYNNKLPKTINNAKFNKCLKTIGRLIPEFHKKVEIRKNVNGKYIKTIMPIYELISSHTARRSFATNLLNAGIPSITIMKATGHKTEKSFFAYIKITDTQHQEKLLKFYQEDYNRKNNIIEFKKAN